jgi:hypothetical protein
MTDSNPESMPKRGPVQKKNIISDPKHFSKMKETVLAEKSLRVKTLTYSRDVVLVTNTACRNAITGNHDVRVCSVT